VEREGGDGGRLIQQMIMEFLKDLWLFLKERKKWWLVPLIILVVLIAVLVVLGGSSALAPFIYTLF
jgi:hypothetical protein